MKTMFQKWNISYQSIYIIQQFTVLLTIAQDYNESRHHNWPLWLPVLPVQCTPLLSSYGC